MTKTGPTFAIPCDRAKVLAGLIEKMDPPDPECLGLVEHMRHDTMEFTQGFSLVCVAEEDFTLWPGGPDIRDYQIGGRGVKVSVIVGGKIYSNDLDDLTLEDLQGEDDDL